MVKGQPRRFVAGHSARAQFKEVRWEIDSETGCWNWLLAVDVHGYPKETRGGRRLKAHRAAYEDAYGVVPAGCDVHHRCENKRCVNPAHLQALTPEAHARLHAVVAA